MKDTTFSPQAKRRLREEYFVWMTTVGSDLAPQPRPVWFIWEKDSFLIYSQPNAHKAISKARPTGLSTSHTMGALY